jgi:hypothetical protein
MYTRSKAVSDIIYRIHVDKLIILGILLGHEGRLLEKFPSINQEEDL